MRHRLLLRPAARPSHLPLLTALALLAIACGRPEGGPGDGAQSREARRPNVLVVLVDALRADALEGERGTPSPTPVLDRLAARGISFRRAYSHAPKTVPSVASLFTSTPPWVHRIEAGPDQDEADGLSILSDRLVLAPEVFDDHGYRTGMVTTTGWITPEVGYDQGVDEYAVTDRADAAVVAAAEELIARGGEEPFFLYVHLLDLHDYYHSERLFGEGAQAEDDERAEAEISPALEELRGASPSTIYSALRTEPERFTEADAAFLRRAYDRELPATDAMIGRLLDALEAADVLEETVVVVTSDHGEQFLEHGRLVHGGNALYEEVLRVPLLIAGPGVEPGVEPGTVDEPAGLIDLYPTLFELLGIEVPEELTGRALVGAGETDPEEPAVVVATSGSAWKLVTGRWSYILSEKYAREELYDLKEDPGETRDLLAENPEVAGDLRRRLAHEIRSGRRHVYLEEIPEIEQVGMSEDVEETLRSLGYLN